MGDELSKAPVRYCPPGSLLWRYRWWSLFVPAAVFAPLALLRHDDTPWYFLVMYTVVFLVRIVMHKSHDFVADSVAIRRPRRGSDIPWGEIEAVLTPGRFDTAVQVRLCDGQVRGTGFPTEYAERLAEVGNRPLEGRHAAPPSR